MKSIEEVIAELEAMLSRARALKRQRDAAGKRTMSKEEVRYYEDLLQTRSRSGVETR